MQWSMQWRNDREVGREKKEENLTSQNRSHNFHGWGLSWLLTSISMIFGWCEQIRWLSWGLKEKIAQLMRCSARRWFQIFFFISTPIPGKFLQFDLDWNLQLVCFLYQICSWKMSVSVFHQPKKPGASGFGSQCWSIKELWMKFEDVWSSGA